MAAVPAHECALREAGSGQIDRGISESPHDTHLHNQGERGVEGLRQLRREVECRQGQPGQIVSEEAGSPWMSSIAKSTPSVRYRAIGRSPTPSRKTPGTV